jgi:RimJ/RimL family protein N-acetyltransferase
MLKNNLIELRQWQESDRDDLVFHANNINVAKWLDKTFPHPYTMLDAEVWIQLSQKDNPLQKFAIVHNNQACGAISVGFRLDILALIYHLIQQ